MDSIEEAFGLFKSIKATFDLSAPLRQGLPFLLSNPKLWLNSFVNMHKQAISSSNYKDNLKDIRQSKDYKLMQDSGLALMGVDGKQENKHDEQFSSKLVNNIPLYNKIYDFSARGYSGFMNNLSVGAFRQGAKELQNSGYTFEDNPEMFKALASVVNNSTGRGKSAQGKAGKLLNMIFFSPKMITSRFLMLHDLVRTDIPINSPSRKMAAMNLLGTAASVAVFNVLATAIKNAFDDDDEDNLLDGLNFNPIHTDFTKVRAKDTVYDITAGFSQIIRTLARFITAKSINSKGDEKDLFKTYSETPLSPVSDFLLNKLSPLSSIIYNTSIRKSPFNRYKEFNQTTSGDVLRGILAPLSVDMLIDNAKDKDNFIKDLGEVALSFYGAGVMQYNNSKSKSKPNESNYPKVNTSTSSVNIRKVNNIPKLGK